MSDEPIDTAADLGRELKRWARTRTIKVAALAKRLNRSQSTLYAYLAGTTLPQQDVLVDLFDVLAVPAPERRRLMGARDEVRRGRPVRRVPNELPADPAGFIGRGIELSAMDAVLGGHGVSARIVSVSGPAGVGKTALAVRWCHRVADALPCVWQPVRRGRCAQQPRQRARTARPVRGGRGELPAGVRARRRTRHPAGKGRAAHQPRRDQHPLR